MNWFSVTIEIFLAWGALAVLLFPFLLGIGGVVVICLLPFPLCWLLGVILTIIGLLWVISGIWDKSMDPLL